MQNEFNHAANDSPRSGRSKRVTPIAWFFVILVALGMAEVASSYPTAGGLYYWAAKLADEAGANGARWSWFVGWFNLVGQVAVTAGIFCGRDGGSAVSEAYALPFCWFDT